MTDFPDWQQPQANATAINSTGVPLVRNISVLNTSGVLAVGTTTTLPLLSYGAFAEGYLIEVIPQHPGANIFVVDLAIQHNDASGNPVAIEQVTLSNWQNVGNDTSMVRGRLLGTSLTVTCLVATSAFINTVTGGAVTADSVQVRQCALLTYVPNTGKRVPVIASSVGLLLATSSVVSLTNVIGNEQLVAVLPDYTGPVIVNSATSTGGGFLYAPTIKGFTVANGAAHITQIIFNNVGNGTPLLTQCSLPSTWNLATIVNRAAVAGSAGFGITVAASDQ